MGGLDYCGKTEERIVGADGLPASKFCFACPGCLSSTLPRVSNEHLIEELKKRDAWPPTAEVTDRAGSIDVEVLRSDSPFKSRLQLRVVSTGGEERRVIFPLPWLAQLVAVALREAGAATFRWSRKSGRHQVSAAGKGDVREFAGSVL